MRIRIGIGRVSLTLCGVLVSPTCASTLTTLYSFDGTHGAAPCGKLLLDDSGNLYGATASSSTEFTRTIYRFSLTTNTMSTLVPFVDRHEPNDLDVIDTLYQSAPNGSLVSDADGNLYGTTKEYGGLSFRVIGTVFKLDASANYQMTVLDTSTEFDVPNGGMTSDFAGNLFGTTQGDAGSGGTVFKLDASNDFSKSTLAHFLGLIPEPGLLSDPAGNIYGSISGLVDRTFGTVFKLDSSNDYSLVPLANFSNYDGWWPNGGLVSDVDGNLYGTTLSGGNSKLGTVFRLDASNGYSITTLAHFSGENGARPHGNLLADSAGNLFGIAGEGGEYDHGTVFRLDASKNYALTTVATFDGQNGSYPETGLIADLYGNLFGVTRTGGVNNLGTIFTITGAGFVVPEASSACLLCITIPFLALPRLKHSSTRSST